MNIDYMQRQTQHGNAVPNMMNPFDCWQIPLCVQQLPCMQYQLPIKNAMLQPKLHGMQMIVARGERKEASRCLPGLMSSTSHVIPFHRASMHYHVSEGII